MTIIGNRGPHLKRKYRCFKGHEFLYYPNQQPATCPTCGHAGSYRGLRLAASNDPETTAEIDSVIREGGKRRRRARPKDPQVTRYKCIISARAKAERRLKTAESQLTKLRRKEAIFEAVLDAKGKLESTKRSIITAKKTARARAEAWTKAEKTLITAASVATSATSPEYRYTSILRGKQSTAWTGALKGRRRIGLIIRTGENTALYWFTGRGYASGPWERLPRGNTHDLTFIKMGESK